MTPILDTQREDQSSITVTVDERELPFVFAKSTGGKVSSTGTKTFPGAMQPEVAHGGPITVEDLTLEGEFVPDRDGEVLQWLKSRAGKGDANAVENGLDADGNVWGRVNAWTGKLKEVDTGNYDASSSKPRTLILVIEADGVPA